MTSLLIYLAVILGLVAGGLYAMQPAMVFLPARELAATPADWGLEYEDVWIEAEDGLRLHGWYLPHPPGARKVLLFFHGNAGNISHRQASLEIFHRLGLNVLILDYRGYGRSEGRPSEQGLYRDARAAWAHLVEVRGVAPPDIVLFGRSLGGAVAAQLASEVQPGALILESTFSSARDLAREIYPLLSWLIVSRYEFDTVARLAQVRCPVLVLHSREDEIIPFALGRRVYAAARQPKMFQTLRGDHNGGFLLSQPGYARMLADFLSDQVP
jgi:fermentation-respiration switch protein FrsA (DUF1100 family)